MKEEFAYLRLCLRHRLLSVFLSSAAYVYTAQHLGEEYARIVLISSGMLGACLLTDYLYIRAYREKGFYWIVVVMEVLSYGAFMLISGGFKSSYMWYFISCLPLFMLESEKFRFIFLVTLWYLVCAVVGSYLNPMEYMLVNIFVGMIVLVSSMYIVNIYVRRQKEHQHFLMQLNLELQQERAKAEYALKCSTDIYDLFDLMGISHPDYLLEHLLNMIERTLAVKGFILVKLDAGCGIDKVLTKGISEEEAEAISETLFASSFIGELKQQRHTQRLQREYAGNCFEFLYFERNGINTGVLIRKCTEAAEYANEDFYMQLLAVVFSTMEVYKQLETYISMEEKNRIAGEIHDTIIQKMFAILCSLKELELFVQQEESPYIKEKLSAIRTAMQNTMSELREAIYGIKFEESRGEGFIAKIGAYLEEIGKLNNVEIEQEMELKEEDLLPVQKNVLYRVACEACNNAIRHGLATHISLRMKKEEGFIILHIADNGKGFAAEDFAESKGMGIANMQRLAMLLEGRLTMKTDGGASVLLQLPCKKEGI